MIRKILINILGDMKEIEVVPGQAILYVANHANIESNEAAYLKRLYLLGASITSQTTLIKALQDKGFKLRVHPHYISEDQVRRFFETRLAYETLKINIKKLEIDTLKAHLNYLVKLVPPYVKIADMLEKNEYTLRAVPREYINLIKDIKSVYADFSEADKEKIIVLAKSFLVCLVLRDFLILPLDIYGKEEFSNEERGKKKKSERQMQRVLPYQLGLLKSTMSVYPFDPIFSKAMPSEHVRPADEYNFVEGSEWERENFYSLVDVFSGSLSGTTLLHFRIFLYMKEDKFKEGVKLVFNTKELMEDYLKCYISLLLHYSGGHSFYEFLYPLGLAPVKKSFNFIKDFKLLNLENIFLQNNEIAYTLAFNAAKEFNELILVKKQIKQELMTRIVSLRLPILQELEKIKWSIEMDCRQVNHVFTTALLEMIEQFLKEVNDIDQAFDLLKSQTRLQVVKAQHQQVLNFQLVSVHLLEIKNFLAIKLESKKKVKPIYLTIYHELQSIIHEINNNPHLSSQAVIILLANGFKRIQTAISDYKNSFYFFKNNRTKFLTSLNENIEFTFKQINSKLSK